MISYGAGGTGNASLLAKYGFVRESNPNDRLACLAGLTVAGLDAAALERAAAAATEARGGRWLRERSTDGQLQAALASLVRSLVMDIAGYCGCCLHALNA